MRLRIPKWMWRSTLGLLLLLTAIVSAAWLWDVTATSSVMRTIDAPGEFVAVNGVRMHYVCQGELEPTLVFLHGYAGGASDWRPLMDALPPQQRACAFDRLGSDYSDSPTETDRDISAVVDDLNRALDQLDIRQPIVVGHSLGGALATLYAASYPVTGVVSVDGLSSGVADEVVHRMGSYASLSILARLGLLRPFASSFVSPVYQGELRARQIALRSRSKNIVAIAREGKQAEKGLTSQLLLEAENSLTVPLLIIAAGASDVPEGEQFARSLAALAERYPGSTYRVVPTAPHYVMASHPAGTATLIIEWMENEFGPSIRQ